MNTKPIEIKINYSSGKQNFITFPARLGSMTTNGFIYSTSLKQISKFANKYAKDLSQRIDIDVDPSLLVHCLEIGITAFLLNQWGYIAEMQMSKPFVMFYNIAACAFLSDTEYAEHEIDFDSDEEFIKITRHSGCEIISSPIH